MSKPIWQRRTVISLTRNVSVVLWPPNQDDQGHEYPPSIVLQEGKNVGTKEQPNWQNKEIRLTLDKLPNIVQDLQLAYQMAVLEDIGSLTHRPTPQNEPKLTGQIYEVLVKERRMTLADLLRRFNTSEDVINTAIDQLKAEGLVKVTVEGLQPYLEIE